MHVKLDWDFRQKILKQKNNNFRIKLLIFSNKQLPKSEDKLNTFNGRT